VFTRDVADDEMKEFQHYGAALLFALLPKELIVRIISAIMVEKRIVFVCPNMRILSAIVYAPPPSPLLCITLSIANCIL
jgi:hypothetical protein